MAHAAGSVATMPLNSSKEMTPSPSRSTATTIYAHCSAVISSPTIPSLRSVRRSSSTYSAEAARSVSDWSPSSNSAPSSSRLMNPSSYSSVRRRDGSLAERVRASGRCEEGNIFPNEAFFVYLGIRSWVVSCERRVGVRSLARV